VVRRSHDRAGDGSAVERVALANVCGNTDPTGILPAALVVAVLSFAWLPPYRVLMVRVYDRTESLLIAMLMHMPISVTTFTLASEATSSTGPWPQCSFGRRRIGPWSR
jgi:hypothetical protein